MDDLMNKVGALIEAHVKSEVEARGPSLSVAYGVIEDARQVLGACKDEGLKAAATRVVKHRDALLVDNAQLRDRPSKDEIRRGVRALGFWEKLVETLCVGPADEATFEHVMERIQVMKEEARDERNEWKLTAEDCQKQIDVLYEHITTVHAERDEARRTEASFTAQFDAMREERDTTIKQFEWMREERDAANRSASKYRTMWEQLHRAQSEEIGAAEQLNELLSAFGLVSFDCSAIVETVNEMGKRDKRLVAERDEACAAKDKAVRDLQEMREKVQALELKLLEVRKAAAQEAPEKHAKKPDVEPSEFQVGDLVARHMRGPGCWGTVTDVDGDYVQVSYPREGEGVRWHMERELKRKPVEPGDRVRVTGNLSKGSPFAGRVGTARAKERGGLYGEWRIDKPEGSGFATCARLVVAVAP